MPRETEAPKEGILRSQEADQEATKLAMSEMQESGVEFWPYPQG